VGAAAALAAWCPNQESSSLLTFLINGLLLAATCWRSVLAAILITPLLVCRCMRGRCAAGARGIAPAEDAPARTSPGPLPPCWAGGGRLPPSHWRIAPQPARSHPCNARAIQHVPDRCLLRRPGAGDLRSRGQLRCELVCKLQRCGRPVRQAPSSERCGASIARLVGEAAATTT